MVTEATYSWRDILVNPRLFTCVFTGFASGMPLFLILHLVPAWLREGGVDLATIGLFSLAGMPYVWKFLWAPAMDRWVPPFMGRRRGWMFMTQVALLLSIGALGMLNPIEATTAIALLVTLVAFFSASQDIALDAFRREILRESELGIGNAVHVSAYRVSVLVPGSLSLVLADMLPWSTVFWITAAFMSVGMVMTLVVREPDSEVPPPAGLWRTIVDPFSDYLERRGWKNLLLILSFMVLYKLGDNMATALSTPFYLDLGFTKTEIGLVAKHAALWPSILGGLLGGLIMVKTGINKALWLFGVVQLVSILGFAVLADQGPLLWLLATVIAFEYLGVGLGTAAFLAFMFRETNKAFAASQIALLTALAALPRTFANASTGFLVESMGWVDFFLLCTLMALPGMVLLYWVAPWSAKPEEDA